MTQRQRLLVNWIYYPPIGHAIEGLCHAHRFLSGSPDLEIGVLLPSSTGIELGQCLPGSIRVYPIDLARFERDQGHKDGSAGEDEPFAAFAQVPREWDFLFTDVRLLCPTGSQVLDRCQVALRQYIRAGLANRGWDDAGFPSSKLCPMVFQLPQSAMDFAAEFLGSGARPRISLLLGSSSDAGRTPPLAFWHELIDSLTEHIPGAEFVLLGALAAGRTRTRSVTQEGIAELESRHPNLRNAFDKGLLNQLALAEASDLCISPHSGMTFAVQCVGTPCLYLSGHCAEYWLNGVPFVSVFPQCDRYPCHWPHPEKLASHEILAECIAREAAGRPFLCQDRPALSDKIPEIVATAQQLIAGELGFHDCLRAHQRLLCERGVCGTDEWPYDGGAGLLDPRFVFPAKHRPRSEATTLKAYDVEDHVAEIYDQAETQTDDVALLRQLLSGRESLRILEPFCGNGRILVPLAEDGHTLVGLDQSRPMLASAGRRVQRLPRAVQERISLVLCHVTAERWPDGFDLVILGANCFYELATASEQEGCIRSARAALRPGGCLYLDNNHMEGDLDPGWREPGIQENRFPTGTCADGTRLRGTMETIWFDAPGRLARFRRTVEVTRPDGTTTKTEFVEQKHPPCTAEMRQWLAKYGFDILAVWGGRDRSPYCDTSGRAIFWAELKA